MTSLPMKTSQQSTELSGGLDAGEQRLHPHNNTNRNISPLIYSELLKCWNVKLGIIAQSECQVCSDISLKARKNDEDVKFTYPEHESTLVQGLCKQREEGRYLDCAIKIDSVTIVANKSILSSFSGYINGVFRYYNHPLCDPSHVHQQSTEVQRSIELNDVNQSSMEALVDCAYRGYMNVQSEELTDFFRAADFLCVSTVYRSSASSQIQFNKNEYLRQLLNDFRVEHQEKRFVDCVISVGSLTISAHQSVLSAFSDYFNDIFRCKHNSCLQTEKTVDLHYLHPISVKALINYAYTGEIVFSPCNFMHLIHDANFLGFKSVLESCYSYLVKSLSVDNCLSVYKKVLLLKNRKLKSLVKIYIRFNFTEIALTDEFLTLDGDLVLEFLENNRLEVMELFACNDSRFRYFFVPPSRQETILLHSILRYTHCKKNSNRSYRPEMLARGVRLPLVPLSTLEWLLESRYCRSLCCKEIVRRAIECSKSMKTDVTILESLDAKSNITDDNGEGITDIEYSRHWTKPRKTWRMYYSSFKVAGYDLHQPSNQSMAFDDSQLNIPAQYISGMAMYTRYRRNVHILAGIVVTYNDSTSVLHGGEDTDQVPYKFKLDDEFSRFTKVEFATRRAESDLIVGAFFETNHGERHGYYTTYGPHINTVSMSSPKDSLYLAYLSGSVDIVDGLPTLRNVEFGWAMDLLSMDSYDEDHYNRYCDVYEQPML